MTPSASAAGRPFIYACQPSYGPGHKTSKRRFFSGAVKPDSAHAGCRLILEDQGSSLLANTFNGHWAQALNFQLMGREVRYFAMLHDDVVPEDGWLGKLLAVLDATGADLVSAVVPIKDARVLTSTALDDEDDPWEVYRRLTLQECLSLPETFAAEDCWAAGLSGTSALRRRPLLVNTGCWACRFDRPWRFQVHFQIHDRIDFVLGKDWESPAAAGDGERACYRGGEIVLNSAFREGMTGAFVNRGMSEDWDFSRQLNRLGCRILATRAVRLTHEAGFPYPNWDDVGGWEHDRNMRRKWDPTWKDIPQGVDGWLTEAEGRCLARLADGKDVLEIGSYCGLSSVWLARPAHALVCVDTFDGRGTPKPRDTEAEFRANLERYGVASKVRVLRAASADVSRNWQSAWRVGTVDLAFIDGAHDEASVRQDADLALALLRKGGRLAFHDYQSDVAEHQGVTRLVDELLTRGARLVERVGLVAVLDVAGLDPNGESNGRAEAEISATAPVGL